MSAPGTLDVWTGSFSVTGDFSASSVSLNGDGSSIVVAPGQTVNVTYNFNIWDDPCPGCSTQLVTGLLTGTTGVHGGSCAFAGDAGLYPGASGSENVNLTAPLAPGVYYVTASYQWQFTCAQALTAYAGGTTGRAIGQIEVLGPSVVLYEGGTSAGNIGPRASADAICAANLPAGYANYHAFIGYSASDSIANMPANYGIPTNIPIRSASNILIANNWTDLMDGTIVTSLTGAGVAPDGYWWSGVDNASGIHTDGVTQDCTDWTSNLNATPGTLGSTIFNDTNWMFITSNAACDPVYSILCIGY